MSRAGYDWLDVLDAEVALTKADYDPSPNPLPPPIRGTRTPHPAQARGRDWMLRATCRHVPEAERWIFWPSDTDTDATRAALDVCATCPVTADCLAYAIDAGEEGVWGGTTDAERAYLVAVPDPDDRWIHERWVSLGHCAVVLGDGAWCDRETGHKGNHHVNGEPVNRRKATEAPPPGPRPINHGTPGGYRTHLRRGEQACESCLTAHRQYVADRAA